MRGVRNVNKDRDPRMADLKYELKVRRFWTKLICQALTRLFRRTR